MISAIAINTVNFGLKLGAWAGTGSHSMFSEAIHSMADTLNQMILAYGIHKSNSAPSKDHPYGYSNAQYVTALISGVGIFCLGAGLSVYHGITGLLSHGGIENIWLALGILGASFLSESVTLALAIRSIKRSARDQERETFIIDRSRCTHTNVRSVRLISTSGPTFRSLAIDVDDWFPRG